MQTHIARIFCIAIACASALLVAGCHTENGGGAEVTVQQLSDEKTNSIDPTHYDPLRVGDRVEVDLNAGTDKPFTPIVTDIKGDGSISLQEIGSVQAAGITPGDLEREIQTNYVPAYYTHMSVTVVPLTKFYYVGGEINPTSTGGKQQYTGPITVTQAIRAAGDFNPFAAKTKVMLRRGLTGKTYKVNCVKAIDHPEFDLPVYPGDTIFVPRRFW